jgi:hypothetical protein
VPLRAARRADGAGGVAEASILVSCIIVGAPLAAFDLAALAYLRRRRALASRCKGHF